MSCKSQTSSLGLNWEKCHFMVIKGIVLGHKVSSAGLEVGKAKIDVIAKLPPPTNVKAVRSLLGHAVFDFNKECINEFESLKEKLTNAPIMVSPDWSQLFELMCDASDFVVGAVLGQREGKHFCPIYFSSKTLNNAQQNYTVTEKELLAVFDIEIKNKKGAGKCCDGPFARLENPHLEELKDDDIDDNFPDKTLINVSSTEEDKIPWFADFANYLVGKILRKGLTYAQRCKFFLKLKHYFWDEPYLFKMCPDGMIRRCVYGAETRKTLDECHHGSTGGHYCPSTTAKKVFDAGFYWPTIFKEAHTLVQNCDAYQRSEAKALPTNDARVVISFLKKLFSRFGIPNALISDREFARDKVLLYNSKYKFKAPKLRSKWDGPFMVKHGFTSGYVELYDKHGGSFVVNGHHVKLYHDEEQINKLTTKEIHLMLEEGKMEAIPFMAPFLADYRETMPWVTEKPFIYSVVENTCNEATLYDLDETGKGMVKGNFLYVKKDPSKKSPLGEK
ncbi:reverse transcriptase domain-containing protein [Tanacetum coccineum]|uniref:Reverse transcriptase domain-containing protein n=1 Tax=Tanacetum coccineum TaxID=301880 RepID=A0ABQ5CIZ6_9ASTR